MTSALRVLLFAMLQLSASALSALVRSDGQMAKEDMMLDLGSSERLAAAKEADRSMETVVKEAVKRPSPSGSRGRLIFKHVPTTCPLIDPRQRSLCVVVIAAVRPEYLEKVLESLSRQTDTIFSLMIYVDHVDASTAAALKLKDPVTKNDDVRRIAKRASDSNLAGSLQDVQIIEATTHHGIARLSWRAQTEVFGGAHGDFDRLVLLEEDHLIGYTYIEAMQKLLDAAETFDDVGMVNGNFVDTPSNSTPGNKFDVVRPASCVFQKVPYDQIGAINGHNVWAWGTNRRIWERMKPFFDRGFIEARLNLDPYEKRNYALIKRVIHNMCPDTGYNAWGGQDWLRACAFHAAGFPKKLQPMKRLMSYIGREGMQVSTKTFDNDFPAPVSAASVTYDVHDWQRSLCTGICESESFPWARPYFF